MGDLEGDCSNRNPGVDRRKLLIAGLATICAPAIARADLSAPFPTKPVRFVVPFGAGALTDSIARVVGQKLSEKWGQSVIVENKPGAGGSMGSAIVAKAPADGYTFLFIVSSHASNPALMKLPYDSLKDFAFVSLIAKSTNMLMASHDFLNRSDNPDADLEKFLAYAKGRTLAFGHPGVGTMNFLVGALLGKMAGINFTPVGYRGAGEAMNDLMGGHLALQIATIGFSARFVQSGKVAGLGITSAARHPVLPNVPTFKEAGLDIVADEWWGMAAPARTPPEIIQKVNQDVRAVLDMPEVKQRLKGADLMSSTPDEFRSFVESETTRWGKFIRTAGIRAE